MSRAPHAVILAAGMSRRLRPLTEERPKCLLQVGARTILDWQLHALYAIGVRNVAVVVGYRREQIKEHVLARWSHLNFSFIENIDYETTNTLFSLAYALAALPQGDFYYLNADVVLHRELLERLRVQQDGGFLAVDRRQCREEEVKVQTVGDRIAAIGKHLLPSACAGEFVGVAKFSGAFAAAFREKVAALAVAGNEMRYFECALDAMAGEVAITLVDITGIPCIEVDFIEDYEFAVQHVGARL